MKKINNKGFTLIEMIIAMTILGIVISLGYGVFNGSQKALRQQTEVFNSQTTINLINKFLSKDLEKSRSISGPLENSNEISDLQAFINSTTKSNPKQYYYEINLGKDDKNEDTKITYIVDIKLDKRSEYIYDITRLDENNSSIKILSNRTSFENDNIEIPFIINLVGVTEAENDVNSGIYNIEISYKDKNKQSRYEFSVKSRIV